jgi:2-polyprenyl-3-methyl-5-hydroxy-6-metoxy-1,4-benzoquinol methylase
MAEWWQGMFESAWQGVQLSSWWDAEAPASATKIETALVLDPGSRVLDVACGAGPIAIELAARGHEVTGVDITMAFLDEARRRAEERGVAVAWDLRDMRDLPWEEEFDAVVSFGGSFGYFDDDETSRFVEAVARTLRPGGRFLIDTVTLESLLPNFRARSWEEAGDTLVATETTFDIATSRVETRWTFARDGAARATAESSIRVFSYAELTSLLRRAGFGGFVGFDSELRPFELGSDRLVLVATKDGDGVTGGDA